MHHICGTKAASAFDILLVHFWYEFMKKHVFLKIELIVDTFLSSGVIAAFLIFVLFLLGHMGLSDYGSFVFFSKNIMVLQNLENGLQGLPGSFGAQNSPFIICATKKKI